MTSFAAVAGKVAALPPGRRAVALAGAPASGKSTLAERLAVAVTDLGRPAQVVPMDGFHLSNEELDRRGLRARKGAPETFDAAGLTALLRDFKSGTGDRFPTFDRSADRVVADGGRLTGEIAIVEGNYLLLDEEPWRALHPLWDLTIALDVPEEVLRARLLARWRDHGFDAAAARAKAEGNDLPNARRVRENSIRADILLQSEGPAD